MHYEFLNYYIFSSIQQPIYTESIDLLFELVQTTLYYIDYLTMNIQLTFFYTYL